MNDRVFFIIVRYRGDTNRIKENICLLVDDCHGGVVVDNSGEGINRELEDILQAAGENFSLLSNEINVGIAAAINQGIKQGLATTADLLLILDDDSTLSGDALGLMIKANAKLQSGGETVAAVGPCFRDKVTGRDGVFPVFQGLRTKRRRCADTVDDYFRCEFLMSSGSLIPRNAIEKVGLMREELFIDLVDTEWCLRARSMDMSCYVVRDAKMTHSFGSRTLPVVNVSYRVPVRHYYIFRNSIHMLRLPYIPTAWKLLQISYLLRLFIVLLIFAGDRLKQAGFSFKGSAHGFFGILGPVDKTGNS